MNTSSIIFHNYDLCVWYWYRNPTYDKSTKSFQIQSSYIELISLKQYMQKYTHINFLILMELGKK